MAFRAVRPVPSAPAAPCAILTRSLPADAMNSMTVFVSYSHRDKQWLDRLQVHLRPLARGGDLELWDDTRLDPGDQWRTAIRGAIEQAAASVLLISADFLASDFVATEELPALLRRAERAGTRIIPIIVGPCRLASHPDLAAFQAVNSPSMALSKLAYADAEDVFVRVAEQVDAVLTARRSAAASGKGHAKAGSPGEALFADLQVAAIMTSILMELAAHTHGPTPYTLSHITQTLSISSRKLAFDAVERLLHAEWIEKVRTNDRTGYTIATEGVRQLQRLVAATDGPIRRAVATH
jgi:TIR domain